MAFAEVGTADSPGQDLKRAEALCEEAGAIVDRLRIDRRNLGDIARGLLERASPLASGAARYVHRARRCYDLGN